jgi:hypothetical protein
VRLPLTEALPALFAQFTVDEPAQRGLLERASQSWAAQEALEDRGEHKVPGRVVRAEWETAEAFWLSVGLSAPVCEWPWSSLQDLIGSILPGDVGVIGARTGDGKSTFVANLIRGLVWPDPRKVSGITVAPLEQSPAVFQVKLACLDVCLPIPEVFRHQWHRMPDGSRERLLEAVARQGQRPLREAVNYCPASTLNREGLATLVSTAAEWHHRLVIIDHLHHMEHGDGPENRGIRATMKLAKDLARRHDIAILFTAQLGRGDLRDRKRKFYPPELTDLQGASGIEQVADWVLLLHQPLLAETKSGDIEEVLTGQRDYRSVFKLDTVAVTCAKHRLDGTARHQGVELRFSHGRITDLWPSWRTGPEPAYQPGDARED